MTRLHEQIAFIRLEPLTPIHIGSGDSLDPLGYLMKEVNGQPYLYPVDVQAWVEEQPNPSELAEIFSRKPLTEIRAYLAKEIAPVVDAYAGAPVRVASREVYETYGRELRAPGSPSQLLIDPALKNSLTGALLIPGSSIKGAIRTAVIDCLDQKWGLDLRGANRDKGGYEKTLEDVFGKVGENVFRDLKVGDFPAALGESVIVTAKEVRQTNNPQRQGTPKSPCEASLSRIMLEQPYALHGRLALGAHNGAGRDALLTVQQGVRKKTWSLDELMGLCNEFYGKRYRQEHDEFYSKPHLSPTAAALAPLEEALLNPEPGSMILRLGRYSHIECMTVENNQPQTRMVKGQQMPHGTTRTLADGCYPFGWALLSLVSAEEYAQACAHREEADAAFLRGRRDRREELAGRHMAAMRQQREREQAERERREAEAKLQAQLAAMSPEERLVHVVEAGTCSENQVVELFGKLGVLPEDLKDRAARAVKSFWVKGDKWEKKKCTDKQWAKVQKVKALLGET